MKHGKGLAMPKKSEVINSTIFEELSTVKMIGSDVLTTPFSYYSTFVIEEKFGFNKTTVKTFFLDKKN